MSAIATLAGIQPGDSPDVMAQKIREWIEKSAPDLTVDGFKRQFELAWNGIAVTDGPYELAGKAARYGWGGSRPNTGGARLGSGPLKGAIRNFHPFAHTTKGNTISKVQWEFSRCNSCGAIGWEVAWDESLWNPAAPEGEGWQDVDGLADKPLTHENNCSYK